MIDSWVKKGLALAIIVLFISVSFQPIIAEETVSEVKTSDYETVDFEEAKEYLFQTLVDISNNPEVKQFLNEHKRDLITNNNNYDDYRNTIKKIRLENPKLLKSTLFTKQGITVEYLEKNYNKGLEIVDILGKEESLKLVDSVKINPELFSELKNIIANDKELSNRVSVLEEMNNNLISNLGFEGHPIICALVKLIDIPIVILFFFFAVLMDTNQHRPVIYKLAFIGFLSMAIIQFIIAAWYIYYCD